MKASINEKGKLEIKPETGVEVYALKKWADDYFKNVKYTGEGETILQICQIIAKKPHNHTAKPRK